MSEAVAKYDILEVAELHAIGVSVVDISYSYGVTTRTVQRWLQDPELKAIVQKLRETSLSSVAGLLQERCRKSVERIAELIDSTDERIAMAASRTNLEMTLRVTEVAVLTKEVQDLREELALLKGEAVKS